MQEDHANDEFTSEEDLEGEDLDGEDLENPEYHAEQSEPDFTDPGEALVDLSELFEYHLEFYYATHDIGPARIEAKDGPTGFTANFPGGRKLTVEIAVAETGPTEPTGDTVNTGEDRDPSLYLYMDTIFVNPRGDEWVASCMVHTDDANADVTIGASHKNPKEAREKLRRALYNMGVTPPGRDVAT